jgi:UDP-glucose 4-epimerase
MSVSPSDPTGSWFIVGGAGFIGGHLVDRLLAAPDVTRVTVFDNFSSGREWHLSAHGADPRLTVRHEDVHTLDVLSETMVGHETVVHLASNPDIAKALTEPRVDFDEGTVLTFNVLEAMRETGANRILYASGSGVYGDLGDLEVDEDYGPLVPVSTYGASKLAGEVMIAAYCAMFDMTACVFRFANVVGSRQTHGVGFDFVRKLRRDPSRLEILGDGQQSKSYIHIDDVLSAILLAHQATTEQFRAYNVGTGDYITVREIADLAAQCAGLDPAGVEYVATGGDRGWKGDVPIVRLNSNRIRKLGWRCTRSSAEALGDALHAMVTEADRLFPPGSH